ncbi:MAG: transposase [Desulfococcaceae bacterium]
MDWQIRLIVLYVFICNQFHNELWIHCQRFTNNDNPEFTDEEVVTIFLYGIMQKRFEIKSIYNYTANHPGDWYPNLPSYEAYLQRLNRLSGIFPLLTERIPDCFSGTGLLPNIRLIDSFPVVMAKAKRSSRARAAHEFANKGYCASKGIWYYGVKVHIPGIKRTGTLPLSEFIGVTPASDHDLNAFRQLSPFLGNCKLFADLAYMDELEKQLLKERESDIHTPVKKKGQKFLGLLDQLLSTSVSRVRQPIESLFNWIHEKTNIQIASKVRSYNGLMVHVFGRLAAAMFIMVFNS